MATVRPHSHAIPFSRFINTVRNDNALEVLADIKKEELTMVRNRTVRTRSPLFKGQDLG
jgi:hypothetical protein